MAGFTERDPGYNWRDQNRPDGYSGAANTAGGLINRMPIMAVLGALGNPEMAKKLAISQEQQQQAEIMPQVQQQINQKINQNNLTEQERIILEVLGRF